MFTRLAYTIAAALMLSVLVSDQCRAERPKLSRPSEKSVEVRKTSHLIGFRIGGGTLLGEAADEISDRDGGFYEKLLFGLGVLGDYNLTGSLALGLAADYGLKTPPTEWVSVIFYRSLAGSATYRFSPRGRSSFFLRSEFGIMGFHAGDYSLGSHLHLRLAIGEVRATGPTTAVRWEVYYRHVFSKEHDISKVPLLPWDEAPFDVDWIGLDLSFTLGF